MRFALVLLITASCQAATVQVYLAAGQSNATGSWANAVDSTLEALGGAPVTVVHSAHSGAPIWMWTYSGTRQQNYQDDLAAVQGQMASILAAGDTPVFAGIFWFQGEGDALTTSTINIYDDRFNDMLGFYRQDLGLASDPNFTLALIDLNPGSQYDQYRTGVDPIRAEQIGLGEQANGSYLDTRGYNRPDDWHVDALGQTQIGQRMALEFAQTFGVPEPSAALLALGGLCPLLRRRRL